MASKRSLIIISLLSGIGAALSFPGAAVFPLAWVALAPLFWATARLSPSQSARAFFWAGWIFYSILLQWLLANIYWAGGWAIVGYQALSAAMALYWAAFGWLRAYLGRRGFGLALPALLALAWAGMEGLQGVLFTGFGWGALGYSQGANLYAAQWAALGGVLLVSALLIAANAFLAHAFAEPRQRFKALASASAVVVIAHAGGAWMLGQPELGERPLSVGLVQPNFPLEMKWDPEYTVEMVRNTADKSRALSKAADIDLFVWPESMIMASVDDPDILPMVQRLAMDAEATVFTGTLRAEAGREFNSSALITPDGRIAGHYDKIRLAPFGEYVPLGDYFPFIQRIVPSIGSMSAGDEQRVFTVQDRTFGPLICFEVLFPALSKKLQAKGADFLVVVTNLGWFGSSSAIPQEINIARFRAIETGLPIIHAANTGLSGMIDPWGRYHPLQGAFDRYGGFVRLASHVRPNDTIMRRAAGIYALPLPAQRPLPHLARPFFFAAVAISLAALGVGAFMRPRAVDAS